MHKKRIYSDVLDVLIAIFIINFLAFTQYYYKKVSFNSLLESFIIFSNCIFSYSIKFARIVTKNGLTSGNIRVILIILASIYILDKYEVIELLHDISTFQFKDFKIETTKLGTIHDNAKKEVDRLENDPKKNEDKINESKNRLELIEIMIDEPYIVEIINKFLNKKMKSIRIPWNVFNNKDTTASNIGKIFEYEIKADCIKIKNIKSDIKDELTQVYSELINNGVI